VTGADDGLARLARQMDFVLASDDTYLDVLERHITALEEVAATRWPRRSIAAARLRRSLRRSVAHFPDETFEKRRLEATANEAGSNWQERREQRRRL